MGKYENDAKELLKMLVEVKTYQLLHIVLLE